jgi:hypothetical protein
MTALDSMASVSARSLIPAEIPTPLKLLRQADCYQQIGVKYPQRGTFHSYAELLHFALNEGDRKVTTIIPQPFYLRVGSKPYIPDAYLVRAGQRLVIELKPRGEFDAALRLPLETFFQFRGMRFDVLSNESVLEREIEALNWLHVVRTLCTAKDLQTDAAECDLWQYFLAQDCRVMLGDILDPGDRLNGFVREVALYRMLHRGQLQPRWQHARLGLDTEIERCA